MEKFNKGLRVRVLTSPAGATGTIKNVSNYKGASFPYTVEFDRLGRYGVYKAIELQPILPQPSNGFYRYIIAGTILIIWFTVFIAKHLDEPGVKELLEWNP